VQGPVPEASSKQADHSLASFEEPSAWYWAAFATAVPADAIAIWRFGFEILSSGLGSGETAGATTITIGRFRIPIGKSRMDHLGCVWFGEKSAVDCVRWNRLKFGEYGDACLETRALVVWILFCFVLFYLV